MPYGPPDDPSEGHAQHPSSENRVGRRGELQPSVLNLLRAARTAGMTSREIESALLRGHGSVSGALSTLHAAGEVHMLEERRSGQHVYVHVLHVAGRPTRARQQNAAHRVAMESLDALEAGQITTALRILRAYRAACGEEPL